MTRVSKIKKIVNHPYFGFIIIGIILILLQILEMSDVLIKVSMIRGIGKIMIFSIAGLGFSLLLGYSGLASLGTAGFIGLGSYILGFLFKQNFPLTIIIVIAIGIGLAIGALVGVISLRIEGMYLAIVTLIISSLLVELFIATPGLGGQIGLNIEFDILNLGLDHRQIFIIIVVALVVLSIGVVNIIRSHIGRAMLAIKNSPSAAQAMGISIFRYRMLSFIIAMLLAVLAGCFNMMYYGETSPMNWNLALSLNILAAVIVGGSKSIYGIFLGCFLIFGLDIIVFSNIPFIAANPEVSGILSGVLIILVIMFYPDGLAGLVKQLVSKIKMLNYQRKERKYGRITEEIEFALFE